MIEEQSRLIENEERRAYWSRWGPYLSERQWGTVREDYSPHGTAWDYLPHDHARSRAYRWGAAYRTITSGCASPSPSGTGATPSSRSGSSVWAIARAITART